ncbi:MAG TPA: autoinducer 2 import system permease LsrD [Chloroflexi bacterium]|nr:autoinducer 2 import system permease LsrD [Chloroflexota bacterium]
MKVLKPLLRWELFLVVLLGVEMMVFGALNRRFLNLENLLYSSSDFAHIMLAALPLTLVIITGGIDISIAAVMGLASIVLGVTWQAGVDVYTALLLALLVGVVAGTLNGLLVANTDINPLVITLGTLFLFSGLATALAGSLGAAGYEGISGLPRVFTQLAHGAVGPVPYTLIFVIILVLIYSVLLHKTRFGRALYLIGANVQAARFSGVPVKSTIVGAYALSSLGGAMAGAMLTAYFTSARSDLGSDALLPTITAVVLGGASILGGSGTIIGAFVAVLILGYLKQGLLALGVTSDVSQVVIGLLLILVVVLRYWAADINQLRRNRRALQGRIEPEGGDLATRHAP